MSKTRGQGIAPPPPLGEDGNPLMDENASIVETSMTPTVEELMKKIEKLNSELSKLKAKDKKDKKYSSECDDEDMALFMKKFKKYIKKKKFAKGDKKLKSTTKRTYYNCGKYGHFITNCPFERMDDGDDKKKYKPYKKDKGYKRSNKPYKRSPMVKLTSDKNESLKIRAPTPIVMVRQPWLSRKSLLQVSLSSQSSIKGSTLALWQRKISVR
jgi:hypothetical protein